MIQLSRCTKWLTVICVVCLSLCLRTFSIELGKATCKDGTWSPDSTMMGVALSCPLPIDGKVKSKAKAALCVFKKAEIYDADTQTVQKDKIASTFCPTIAQKDLSKQCTEKITECLKDGKDYFQDPKTDQDYKSWIPFMKCVRSWSKGACKK